MNYSADHLRKHVFYNRSKFKWDYSTFSADRQTDKFLFWKIPKI